MMKQVTITVEVHEEEGATVELPFTLVTDLDDLVNLPGTVGGIVCDNIKKCLRALEEYQKATQPGEGW
jgi:hypothetical protein